MADDPAATFADLQARAAAIGMEVGLYFAPKGMVCPGLHEVEPEADLPRQFTLVAAEVAWWERRQAASERVADRAD